MLNLDWIYGAAFRRFRPRRLRLFYSLFRVDAGTRVLDLGGTPYFWRLASAEGLPVPRVTIVNLSGPGTAADGFRWVIADGRVLPFADQSFDIVFCNSLIEHLGERESQRRLAAEIRRVAPRHFIQTPDIRFPVEPHYLAPFLHWAPISLQSRLCPFTPRGLMEKRSCTEWRSIAGQLRLLGPGGMRALFPSSRLVIERLLGWPKSILALKTE